jgi:hypothetical protein
MFEKFTQMLQNLQNNQNVFDPAQFGDPIAVQTSWRPAKGGGSNFRNYKLVQVNPYRVKFRTTIGAIIFSLIFALPGIALLIFLIPSVNWSSIDTGIIVALLLGLIFASIGGYLFYSQMRPIVFDKQAGFLWKGRKPQMLTNEATDKYVRLELVHALQIVAEYISGKNSYYSFELNLVLKNGNRINVVDHGNRNKLVEDAGALAEFLGVPVWDGTIGKPQTNAFSVTDNR